MEKNKLSPVWAKDGAAKRIDQLPKEKVKLKEELDGLKPKTAAAKTKDDTQDYGFGGIK